MRLVGFIPTFCAVSWCLNTACLATTYYVDASRPDDTGDALTWASAKKTIQSAVNLAVDSDTILVTNGIYSLGGVDLSGSNRVCITNSLTVRSVNGPDVTIILARTNALAGVRCVYMSGHSELIGFTLTNGLFAGYMTSGGGIYVEGEDGVISNCIITGNSAMDGGGAYQGEFHQCVFTWNSAGSRGGGALNCDLYDCVLTANSAGNYGGGAMMGLQQDCSFISNSASEGGGAAFTTLKNCRLIGNTASWGGGAVDSTLDGCVLISNTAGQYGGGVCGMWGDCVLNNCTIIGNRSFQRGGGAYSRRARYSEPGVPLTFIGFCRLNNCIVYYNTAREVGHNYDDDSILNHCCTMPLPNSGASNISNAPAFPDNSGHIGANSPCIGAGSGAYASGVDIDGDVWADPPSIGCDEYVASSPTGALSVVIDGFRDRIAAGFSMTLRAVITGRASSNLWDFGDGVRETNSIEVSHAWMDAGPYAVSLTGYNADHPGGVSATQVVEVVPLGEATAYVWTNSPEPAQPYSNWTTAAHAIQDAVNVAVPGGTIIVTDGVYNTGFTVTPGNAVNNRICVTNPVTVASVNGPQFTRIEGSGFTTNSNEAIRGVYLAGRAVLDGFTICNGYTHADGGGIFMDGVTEGTLSNCVLQGNTSEGSGGAVYGGILRNCAIVSNLANSEGGGSAGSTLYNCLLSSNTAVGYSGGGATRSTLFNCELKHNYAFNGAGASYGTLNNSLLHHNSAYLQGGGAYECTLVNCTVVANTSQFSTAGASGCNLMNSIEYGNPNPASGADGDPLFIDAEAGDYRLQAASPCIDAGSNADVVGTTDLAGNPRILHGVVDMGVYETDYVLLTVTNGRDVSIPSNGVHRWLTGGEGPLSVLASVDNGFTQYINAGWSMIGAEPVSGTGNSFNGVLTNDTWLAWLWKTNVRFNVTAAYPGTVVGSESGWYPINSPVVVAAIPGNYTEFTTWAGDVPGGSAAENPLFMVLDQPRTIHAQFLVYAAALGTPWWWLAEHGWTNDFDSAEATDQDADLLFTWQEYIVGSDPTNASSAFDVRIRSGTESGDGAVVEWSPCVSGRLYGIIGSTNMSDFTNITQSAWPSGSWTVDIDNVHGSFGVRVELLP